MALTQAKIAKLLSHEELMHAVSKRGKSTAWTTRDVAKEKERRKKIIQRVLKAEESKNEKLMTL